METANKLEEILKSPCPLADEEMYRSRILNLVYGVEDYERLVDQEEEYHAGLKSILETAGCTEDTWHRWRSSCGSPKARVKWYDLLQMASKEEQCWWDVTWSCERCLHESDVEGEPIRVEDVVFIMQ